MASRERNVAFLKDPAVRCAACDADAPMAARFCRRCGTRLGAAAERRGSDTASAEHKQVTVLVADVQGSMTLSERLDPEEWYRIVTRFFVILAEGVQRVGGVVNRFTGDGIMALFGAPVALEDHAQRACYAALRLRHALEVYSNELHATRNIDLAVRIGIHSGDVVAGRLGRHGRGGYAAMGSTVHLASRMERIAAPGRIFVSETTARLVEGYFHLSDRGQPGRPRGVIGRVYELVGVGTFVTRLERARSRGLLPFVGRSQEQRVLERALEDARAGRGAIVGVRGEVGVGKSRLCHEFLAQCRRQDVAVYRYQHLAHLRGTPHLSLIHELRRMMGISIDEPVPAVRRRINEVLSALDPGATAPTPFIERVLGVAPDPHPALDPDEPAQFRRMIASFFAALGRRRPVVVLAEDLHWIDPASRKLLEIALEVVAGSRMLLLMNFRQEFRVPAVPGYTEITLPTLGPRAANELLDRLLGGSELLASLAREIRQRSNGNPLFIEELVTMLAESGALVGVRGAYRPGPVRARTALPSSLQALLESRIDLLGAREKVVLRAASVIGGTFPVMLLPRVLGMAQEEIDEAIVVLEEGGFITPCDVADEEQYAFRHPMMQEQAYASQMTDSLAAAHAEVAEACIALYANRLDERAALIADHWEAAGRMREAVVWAQRSALWIGQRNLGEGLRGWQRVIALLERGPASREAEELAIVARCRMLELGARLGTPLQQEVGQALEQASVLVERLGNPAMRALLHNVSSQVRAFAGDVPGALEEARAAVRASDEARESGELLLGHRALLVLSLMNAGELGEALVLGDALAAQLTADPPRRTSRIAAQIHLSRAKVRVLTGDPRGARRDLEIAAEASWAAADVEGLALASSAAPTVSLVLGEDAAECVGRAERAVELAEYLGNPYGRVSAYGALGLAHLLSGKARTASRVLHGALLLARDQRVALQREASLLGYLACATFLRGETAHALSLAGEAVHVAQRTANPLGESLAELARAWVLLRANGVATAREAESSLGRVLAIAAAKGSTSLAAIARYHLATVAELLGDEARRARELERARAAFAGMGAAGWQRRIERRLHEPRGG